MLLLRRQGPHRNGRRRSVSEDRTSYIGGPSAATIIGVNPFETPLALWQRLTKRAEPVEVNDAMRSGMRLEAAVLAYAAEELQTAVLPGPFVRDLQLPLGGHLDGLTDGGDVVEAKTARKRGEWGEPGSTVVPLGYQVQCLHYLGLMPRAQVAWVPVLFSGLEFAMFRVERNDELIRQIRQICAAWWETHVVGDMPPLPQTGADVALLFPKDTGRTVIADDAVAEAVERLRAVKTQVSELEDEREALENRIKLAMADAATLTLPSGDVAVTWRATKPVRRFDTSAFKAECADMYAAYVREIDGARRFLIK